MFKIDLVYKKNSKLDTLALIQAIRQGESEIIWYLLKVTAVLAVILAIIKLIIKLIARVFEYFGKTVEKERIISKSDRLNLIFGYSGILFLTFIFFAHLWVLELASSTIAALYGFFWHILAGLFYFLFLFKSALKYVYNYEKSNSTKILKWMFYGTIIGYQFHRGFFISFIEDFCFLFMYFYYIVFFYFFLIELITVIHGNATLFVYLTPKELVRRHWEKEKKCRRLMNAWRRQEANEYENEESENVYPRKIRFVSFQEPGIYYEEYP
ncbi:hypothetical protein GCK72_011579 [Caenorhabditis remanei]|uniref:Uncharacterized protein n=1 Tax=Caenorhabditis remanei TaxID=31234 RepID=A0A6A5HA54_CAERE|nr:hypothetical protein GCK72_011579 [Caenorhabditis remanei]KAF1763313.1 hypothetical protein GCK72_011579 [Caenorhabditis remanei]